MKRRWMEVYVTSGPNANPKKTSKRLSLEEIDYKGFSSDSL